MSLLQNIAGGLRGLFRKQELERDLDEELRGYLDDCVREKIAAGMSPAAALRAARQEFGSMDAVKEDVRAAGWESTVESFWQDLRFGARLLRKSPGFTAVAVLTLALGIGANTAVFSVVDTVLLKPLSYRDPDRIVTLSGSSTTGGASGVPSKQISILNFRDWHDQSSSFEAMAYYSSRETSVMPGSAAEYAQATVVSPEFFRVFAVEPIVGRFFTPEELKQGSGGALMISYSDWQSDFAGDPRVMGKTVRMYGRTLPITGVLPPGFHFPSKTDLWFPDTGVSAVAETRSSDNYLAVGRLKSDVVLERAQTEMTSIAQRLEQQYPESNKGRSVAVTRMRDDMVGDVRLTLYLLLGAVSVVLLIACANTATLLLGKATDRAREVAVRVALGASHRRIMRQLITESLFLAFLGGASGLLLAYWGSKVLVALAPSNLPRLAETGLDARVLAFTLSISLTTSLLFGLVPALYASKVDLSDGLKQEGARSGTGIGLVRLRGVLVVAEIALAVVLLSGAGLLVKSFLALQNVALGFRPENVLVMRATVPRLNTEEGARRANQFFKDVLSQTATLPGVLAAGATMAPPGHVFDPSGQESMGVYYVDHMPAQLNTSAPEVVNSIVAPGTFAALGIPLKSGRDFNDGDTFDKPFVALINGELVRKSFPGENPIGRTIFCAFDSFKGMTIIGVVGDVRQYGPAQEPMPECYMPYQQHQYNGTTLSIVVRTTGNPTALAETLRRLAHETSPDVPIKFTTMEAMLAENVAAPRFRSLLFAVFAGLAVCLAMAGVYGVMAYDVARRTNEIGVRMALGAQKNDVLQLVMGQGMILVLTGVGVGIVGALILTRLLSSMLYGVRSTDLITFASVAIVLTLVAMAACYIPARRATRVNPMIALRHE
jgi:predicted permease